MKIARVFPRVTNHTPKDEYVFIGEPPLFIPPVDEVHVSVTFTWDLPEAERLVRAWEHIAPVKVGGPATGMRGEGFVPGMYVKHGVVFTSRGCPNRCWFCSVWRRDGDIRELPITDGWIVQDDNLLACSRSHFDAVIEMLRRQPKRPQFMGLEAARFTRYHAEAIAATKPKQIYFAYDTPDDYDPLCNAVSLCWECGITKESHTVRTYVLIGYPKDKMTRAEERLQAVYDLGSYPMAMLYRDASGRYDSAWRQLQRIWCRPALISVNNKPNQEWPEGIA